MHLLFVQLLLKHLLFQEIFLFFEFLLIRVCESLEFPYFYEEVAIIMPSQYPYSCTIFGIGRIVQHYFSAMGSVFRERQKLLRLYHLE